MKTVLIVDDEVDIAETLQEYLEFMGYRAILAFDGREALREAVEHCPDLILTDRMMPRMSGDELLERLQATPALRDIPVVTMSSDVWYPGERPFLRKPFRLQNLLAEIKRQLERTAGAKARRGAGEQD